MAAGVIIIFYFFDMYVGWNNIFSCIQQSANAAAVAGSNATTIKDCLVITFFGFLESISNNYGYIALALIIGGLTGFFIAQRQLRSTLGTGQPES
jgi:hypothetical protein